MKKSFFATASILTLVLSAFSVFAQTQTRQEMQREIEAKRAELAALEKRFLSPSQEDRTRFVEFLKLPETGLIRLLPREKFDTDSIREASKGLTMRGGGAYYSFSRLSHEYGYGSDIELSQGWLKTGFAGANYGIMTSLGDIPLENVSSEIPAVQFLASYAPAPDEPKARIEYAKWGKGETIEGTNYASRLPLKADTTYVVRSIDYSSSDVLVAFRVVRIDNDDSVTILWKMVNRYPTPHIDPLKLH